MERKRRGGGRMKNGKRCDDRKPKIENIKRQEGIKEVNNKRKSIPGFCSLYLYTVL